MNDKRWKIIMHTSWGGRVRYVHRDGTKEWESEEEVRRVADVVGRRAQRTVSVTRVEVEEERTEVP